MEDVQRQFRLAFLTLMVVMPIGTLGFMALEGLSVLDAVWLTIITLTTIGYGDIAAQTEAGRVFTLFLVLIGMSAILYILQTLFVLFSSPALRDRRMRRRIQKKVNSLHHHYIICGMGEVVDKTVNYLLQRADTRLKQQRDTAFRPVDRVLDRIFGDDEDGRAVRLHRVARAVYLFITRPFQRRTTILDIVVVITHDQDYAQHLREAGLLAIVGDPTSEEVLKRGGIVRAQALMVMLDSDTEALLTILTADKINPALHITAAALEEEHKHKMVHVGANSVIEPYSVAGQFLNNATLRPAVSEFFYRILFDQDTQHHLIQIDLWDDSPWIGQTLGNLNLRRRFQASVIGIRLDDDTYRAAPGNEHQLNEDEILLIVAPASRIEAVHKASREGTLPRKRIPTWQPIPGTAHAITGSRKYTLPEAEAAIGEMSRHFIICGTDRVARNAIDGLNPDRPFVIISEDIELTQLWLGRGFRVIHGDPTHENTLRQAGITRAQAIMVSVENKAASVITVLNARTMSKRLLITATAHTDDMIEKLERAGADRVLSPFHVAAQFVLLATIQREISEFVQYILFNYETGLETAELYMENTSQWIGKPLAELELQSRYNASVIGVRHADRESYTYAPNQDYIIQQEEVLIIVTPMENFDAMRADSYGSSTHRPTTLRRKVLQSSTFTRDRIKQLIEEGQHKV